MTHRFAGGTRPAPNEPEEQWVGKLENQVLGRNRNQLLRYDVDVASDPALVCGVVADEGSLMLF